MLIIIGVKIAVGNSDQLRYTYITMSVIIFDFDGTIADSLAVVLELFYEMTGHPALTAEEIAVLRRTPSVRQVAKAVGITPRQIPRVLMKGRALMSSRLDEVRPFTGIDSVLAALHADGHRLLMISSNSRPNVEGFLRTHQLDQYFDEVYGGIGLLRKAGALAKVIRQNRSDPSECFYIGDEVRDILAAKKARVRSVAVAWGYNDYDILAAEQPFAVAKAPQDLLKLLQ
jgi:phosphoglycolate phosphatase